MPQYAYSQPPRRFVDAASQAMLPAPDIPRSTFIGRKTVTIPFDRGQLIPFLCDEILPGDHVKYNVVPFVRISTLLFPFFSRQTIDTHFFFVPTRLTWDNWEAFIAGQQLNSPADSVNFTVPQVVSGVNGFTVGSIYDLIGIGGTVGQITAGLTCSISALQFRAYMLIYRDWYRDQNLQTVLAGAVPTGNGPDVASVYAIQFRAKPPDYFTTCLPQPQKFTAPTIPLGTFAPVVGLGFDSTTAAPPAGPAGNVIRETGATPGATGPLTNYPNAWPTSSANQLYVEGILGGGGTPQVYADLAQTTGISINELRQAWLVQSALERDARSGTRYTEHLRAHWRVNSQDARLQRPEFIGGGSSPLNTTPIAQTAPTTGVPLGALGAVGTAAGQHRATYAATEHGYILGIMSVRTELMYQQGIPRQFSRLTKYDFALPDLAGLGEQAVLRKELYVTGTAADDNTVFGYQERYQEYRTMLSDVRGVFRSTAASNIDEWHAAEQFGSAPTLSSTFIVDNAPISRVLAAGAAANGQQYLANILIERDITRQLPLHGTPVSLTSRF